MPLRVLMPNDTVSIALQRLIDQQLRQRDVSEAVICLHDHRSGLTYNAAGGTFDGRPVDVETPFLIASTSKLFGTAMILQLAAEKALLLETPIISFFGANELAGLHRLGGTDHTASITVSHLLSHRSGLPDYFEGKRKDGSVLAQGLLAGRDLPISLADILGWTRDAMTPHFVPGQGRKALYSDTNFFLIGEIIARVTGLSLDDALRRRITGPLGLGGTAFYKPGMAALPLRNGSAVLSIPQALASMLSMAARCPTAADLLAFIRAFFGGQLFPQDMLPALMDWRSVFFPLKAGVGLLQFQLPRWMTFFFRQPELIGHSGISGAFAFHCPERQVSLSGTVNQLAGRSRSYKLMLQALGTLPQAG